jgi:tripartite-type tricarboxylate transporter receptor subunit TctC
MVCVVAAGLIQAAHAQTYPEKPVTLVVGFPKGGPNDVIGRLAADWLSQQLGQPVTVDNRAGSSGNIATEAVTKAAPDGYTLLLVGPANAISGTNPNLPFNFLRDIAPVGGITREALVLVVNNGVAAKTAAELLALAKAKPGQLRMAATGAASSPHLSAELFKAMSGVDLPVIQFAGGGPALKAMAAGEADVMFEPMSAAMEPVRSGALRALAVTTLTRSAALPDLPVLADIVPGYEASAVTGIGVPRGTPDAVIAKLNLALNAARFDPAMSRRLADTGGEPLAGSPAEFGALMAEETEKWGKVVKAAGIKLN